MQLYTITTIEYTNCHDSITNIYFFENKETAINYAQNLVTTFNNQTNNNYNYIYNQFDTFIYFTDKDETIRYSIDISDCTFDFNENKPYLHKITLNS